MLFKSFITATLLLAAQHTHNAHACALDTRAITARADNGTVTYPWPELGDDKPSPPATTGYFINHLALNVRNATRSIDWYNRAFGLRLLFTFHVSEHLTISYMAHAAGGKNGTGYQTAEEMNRDKNNRQGLLEMISLDIPNWDMPAGIKVPNTFSHIGMVVPNITETQKRLEAMGANILKGSGEEFKLEGGFAVASGLEAARASISPEEEETMARVRTHIFPLTSEAAETDHELLDFEAVEQAVDFRGGSRWHRHRGAKPRRFPSCLMARRAMTGMMGRNQNSVKRGEMAGIKNFGLILNGRQIWRNLVQIATRKAWLLDFAHQVEERSNFPYPCQYFLSRRDDSALLVIQILGGHEARLVRSEFKEFDGANVSASFESLPLAVPMGFCTLG
jgi:lactoylglutathione lyase